MSENPGGSIRVRAAAPGGRAAGGLADRRQHDPRRCGDGDRRRGGGRRPDREQHDLRLPEVDRHRAASRSAAWSERSCRGTRSSDCAIGIQVGAAPRQPEASGDAAPGRGASRSTTTTSCDTALGRAPGVRIEAARDARDRRTTCWTASREAFVVLGAPPRTQGVTVVNNLVVGVAKVGLRAGGSEVRGALRLQPVLAAGTAGSVAARSRGREVPLAKALQEAKMTHTKLVAGVKILNNDLARIEGAVTRDQGSPLGGIPAPGIGARHRHRGEMTMRIPNTRPSPGSRLADRRLRDAAGRREHRRAPAPPPPPAPTPTPGRASDNPEDVRARMPLRPTPYQHETKFPPPQQSAEEEEKKSNSAGRAGPAPRRAGGAAERGPVPAAQALRSRSFRRRSGCATSRPTRRARETAARSTPGRTCRTRSAASSRATGSSSPRGSTPARSGSGRAAGAGRRRPPSRSSRATRS